MVAHDRPVALAEPNGHRTLQAPLALYWSWTARVILAPARALLTGQAFLACVTIRGELLGGKTGDDASDNDVDTRNTFPGIELNFGRGLQHVGRMTGLLQQVGDHPAYA